MATNLYLMAKRDVYGTENCHDFQLHKTPTKVTGQALRTQTDAHRVYKAWCEHFVQDSEKHLSDLKNWLHEQTSNGYEVRWYTI